jgi:ankyrin repeat protein
LLAYVDRFAARTVLVASWLFGWQNVGMQQRRRPPDLHRRSCLLAAFPWLPVPALAADAPLREAMRRAEALRDEAQRAGDQPYGAVVLHGALIVGAAPSRVITATDPTAHAEMEAIRDAARGLRRRDLSGCVLVSLPHVRGSGWLGWHLAHGLRRGIDRRRGTPMRRRTLLACGAAWPMLAGADTAALVRQAEAGDLAALRRLLDAGVPVDTRDARRRTALLAATHANHIDVARLLIERGADVNAKDEMQDSPFLFAGAEGRLEILRLTLGAGADLKSTNRYGGTALIPAAHHGHVETVRELLKTGVDVDHVNRLGWTALLEAIILGDGGAAHTEIVRLLVAHGAKLQLADAKGVTPLAHTEQRGQRAIADILRRAGARP